MDQNRNEVKKLETNTCFNKQNVEIWLEAPSDIQT